ncbi:MAG: xanthine dehydrogenase small subunit [Rhodospirillaceae bacterium]|nr:xanthine dehydrogenase small subunit [Rhodospirillaceae bacterium]
MAGGDLRRTVLDYLRLDARLSGTKEGCGEGDCGACAIIVCDRGPDGATRIQAVNSCLLPLAALDGKHALTVEGLAAADALHPVQERMVALHASQCGFCTPGFVMALAAFVQDDAPADDAAIHDALAGNLCRCTGYRPIVEAARQAKAPGQRWWSDRLPAIAASLETVGAAPAAEPAPGYFAPGSMADLAALLAKLPTARLVAGATDLGLAIAKHGLAPAALISVAAVAELRRIDIQPDRLRIGAAATLTGLLPILDPLYPGLGTVLRRFGSRQIRNLATIGGNLCNASPIGDFAPPLLALDAVAHIRNGEGARDLPLADFFTGYRRTALAPGEFLEAVTVPRLAAADRFRVYKLSKRYDQDISTVCAAFRLRIEGGIVREARIAMGGMAATPKRAFAAEGALTGAPFALDAIERAAAALAEDFAPLDDLRGTAAFRQVAAANLLRRFWIDAAAPSGAVTDVMAL